MRYNELNPKRLNETWQNRTQYLTFFELYKKLSEIRDSLKDNLEKLPDMVLFEAFRNQTPAVEAMRKVFIERSMHFNTDQALFKMRLQEVSSYLYEDEEMIASRFITEIDRMRSSRNVIAHTAQLPINLELLTSRLYKLARIYLHEIIYEMANSPDHTIEEIFFKLQKSQN